MRVLLLALLLPLLLACADQPEGRPTVEELEAALWAVAENENTKTEQSVVHCQARRLEDSSFSDRGLRAFVGDEDYSLSKDEKTALAPGGELWVKLQACQQNT